MGDVRPPAKGDHEANRTFRIQPGLPDLPAGNS
jgi:hypothetical protein